MKLRYVTFTGADDHTPIEELVKISLDFPKVEWGILLSESSMGVKSGFPSRDWMGSLAGYLELLGVPVNLSGHLCGSWMRRFISLGVLAEPIKAIGPLWSHFARVQLNLSGNEQYATHFMAEGLREHDAKFILQNGNTEQIVKILDRHSSYSFHNLFDKSGGKGVLADGVEHLPFPYQKVFCGYAGGLSPFNIENCLAKLQKDLHENKEIWIDMQSQVRDENDEFDLTKVRLVLNSIKKMGLL